MITDMADSSENPAYRPELSILDSSAPDELSDILQAIRLHGDGVSRHRIARSQRLDYPSGRWLHTVESGMLRLQVDGGPVLTAQPGDLALVAGGPAHTVRARAGTSWLTGRFTVEARIADPLLNVLPGVVLICGNQAATAWLPLSLQLILAEVETPRPGSRVMVGRILDLLFIHALRDWATRIGERRPGWLTAAFDPAIEPVLTAVRREPQRGWTLTELAALAQLSRSALSARFTELMGVSPGAYVTQHRMDHAAQLLDSTSETVAVIAARTGYGSEATFGRAFKRAYGRAPRSWRTRGSNGAPAVDAPAESPARPTEVDLD